MTANTRSNSPRERGTFARVATVVLAVVYPFVVYLGLTRWTIRGVCAVLVVLAMLLAISRARGLSWAAVRTALVPLLPTVLAATIAGVTAQGWVLLAVPVFINLGLLGTFAATLRGGKTPMIERFARLQEPELSPPKAAHCRQVTWSWVGFFAANAAFSAALAIAAPFEWWAAWCGGLAYLCIGVMIGVEMIVRRWRFGGSARPELPVTR